MLIKWEKTEDDVDAYDVVPSAIPVKWFKTIIIYMFVQHTTTLKPKCELGTAKDGPTHQLDI